MRLLIGERYREKLSESLAEQGIEVFWLPDNPAVDVRLAGHADLSVFAAGSQAVVAESLFSTGTVEYGSHIVNYLTKKEYTVKPSKPQGIAYPSDAGLCLCDTGKYLIYNPRTADPAATAISGSSPVAVSQGYTKCSTCVLNEQSIITSDASVSRASKSVGMDVLQIRPGYIGLDGFDYGFIGGAAFLLNKDMIAFTGKLDGHPDEKRILRFLEKHGLEPVYLTNDPIFDIGGAISV